MRKDTKKRPPARHKGKGQELKTNVVEFPASNAESGIEVTPLQLLAVMLKCVLKDRITDEEVETICSVYYKTIQDWWA